MSRVAQLRHPIPTVHDMRGNMGYPVLLIAMNDDWRELLIEHYSPKVMAGDQMIVGHDATTAMTYWVVRNAAHPQRPNVWAAHLTADIPTLRAAETTR